MSELNNLQEMSNDSLEVYYDDLTRAINSYQNHERDVWTEINQRRDPNFVENKKAVQTESIIHELRTERDRVISQLSKQYDENTLKKESSERVKDATRYMKELQGVVSGAINTEITEKNSEIMTMRRLIINNKKANEHLSIRTEYISYGIFFFSAGSILSLIGIVVPSGIAKSTVKFLLLFIFLFSFYMILKLAWRRRNSDLILVAEKNFKSPDNSFNEVVSIQPSCPTVPINPTDLLVKEFLKSYVNSKEIKMES